MKLGEAEGGASLEGKSINTVGLLREVPPEPIAWTPSLTVPLGCITCLEGLTVFSCLRTDWVRLLKGLIPLSP